MFIAIGSISMNDQSDDEFDHDDLVESKVSIIWRLGENPILPHSIFPRSLDCGKCGILFSFISASCCPHGLKY